MENQTLAQRHFCLLSNHAMGYVLVSHHSHLLDAINPKLPGILQGPHLQAGVLVSTVACSELPHAHLHQAALHLASCLNHASVLA